MQHIQDKALDNLFKSAFENAEIEPSANLWNAINAEAGKSRKKRSFPVFWMAAASVVVLVTVTMLVNKQEKIKLYSTDVAVTPVSDVPVTNEDIPGTVVPKVAVAAVSYKPHHRVAPLKQVNTVTQIQEPVKKDPAMQPVLAKAEVKQPENKPARKIEETVSPEPVVYAQAEITPGNKEVLNENEQADRKGIRNVGDLVNFVVDKVDKRDKKTVRFRTDDDESSLIVNIGFLKFKKRDR